MRQRRGSRMMLHDGGELRTDFRPLRLTVTFHVPAAGARHRQRLTAAQADGDNVGAIDVLAAALR